MARPCCFAAPSRLMRIQVDRAHNCILRISLDAQLPLQRESTVGFDGLTVGANIPVLPMVIAKS
jgi:hypothetical protein